MSIARKLLVLTIAGAATTAPAMAARFEAAKPAVSVVATATSPNIRVYRYPGSPKAFLTLANPNRDGGKLVFLVVQRAPGWERVRLPVRPNGSTGWIRDRGVSLSLDPYRLVVSLSRHTVQLWKGNKLVQTERAGVGRSVLPTPSGNYYLAELMRQPNPNGPYGPYAFGLSAFSNVLMRFGAGPGQIGLHGTDDARSLGTSVSHGCVRISNSAITAFARLLPLGTPIQIAR